MDSFASLRTAASRAAIVCLLLSACSDARDPVTVTDVLPSGTPDASEALPASPLDAGLAVMLDGSVEAATARPDCLTPDSGIVCDDGRFCSGLELCAPSDPSADARGCVAGQPLLCALGETCSELMQQCSLCSDTAFDDADGDGHEARSCGGDDCRDDDATIFLGNAETCDGKDNDCDGVVDAAPAELACMAVAPAASTSTCTAGACLVTCSDPDFDLVAGACVRHDDCLGVTACGTGSCIDGVRAYTCTCLPGFSGTGTTACSDIDECATPASHSCDTAPLACINDPGSFHCTCPATHFGDGQGASGCAIKATAVAAGNKTTCALLAGGSVKCWGSDQFGKLGYGTATETPHGHVAGSMGDALPRVNLGTGRTAVGLAVGSDVTCSALDDGSAKCWGYNGYGALGGGMMANDGIASTVAPLPTGRRTRAVGAGSGMGFALLDDGSLGHWGFGFSGYTLVAGERFTSFDRSPRYDSYHVCAVVMGGAVRCFPGASSYADPEQWGALGWDSSLPLTPATYPFTLLGSGRTATAVALGDAHSCALLDDSTVKCWGKNDHGQLGLGDTEPRGWYLWQMGDALPIVPLGAPVRALSAGAQHTCALLEGGLVKCWGFNDAGQLGQGNTNDVGDQPGEVAALPAIELGQKAVAIDVGSHSCALLESGAIKCWGENGTGQLGQGDTQNRGDVPGSLGTALPVIDLGS